MKKLLVLIASLCLGSLIAEAVKFEQKIYIKASKEKVFAALTTAETVSQYYMCPAECIGTKKGDKVIYAIKGQQVITGEVLNIEKDRIFSHSFRFLPLSQQYKDHKATKVTYRIQEGQGFVILHLSHSGFKAKDQNYHNIAGGWPYILSNLKTYLETGKTLKQS